MTLPPTAPPGTVGSLFSGIGGLDRGVERAGFGPTVWQVEIEPFAKGILRKHWPEAIQYDDVCSIGIGPERAHKPAPVDGLIGGFPCQGNSSAGKGLGLDDPRSGLWREFYRLVGELRPRWAIVENVASGARRWLPYVRRDLHLLGYRTRALAISAFDVGAPHLRRRVFVLAADPKRVELRDEPGRGRGANGQGACVIGDDGSERAIAHANRARQLQPGGPDGEVWRWTRHGDRWAPEPPVPGVAHGVPHRMDRERCLGNAVVPACAEVAARVLAEWISGSNSPVQGETK